MCLNFLFEGLNYRLRRNMQCMVYDGAGCVEVESSEAETK